MLRPAPLLGLAATVAALVAAGGARAAEPDWDRVTQQAADLLSAYIRIDTQNPPGVTTEAAAFLAAELRRAGIASETIAATPEKPILIARLRGKGGAGKPIVLLNHMDVVPADPARWSFPPLSGAVRDGVVYGRGAIDMKGLGIAMLVAMRLLAERGEQPERDLVFLAVPDEEVGAVQGTAWLAQHRPDLFEAEAVWDEGGSGVTDLLPVPTLLISVAEKQLLWLKLIAEGPAGHGSRPFPGAATRRLTEALTRVLESPPAPRLTPIARQLFRRVGKQVPGLEGFALRRLKNPVVWLFADGLLEQQPWIAAMTRDTVSLTMLDAGYKPNVIPERAEAVLDCRLLPDTKPQSFIEQLRKTLDDPNIRIEVLQNVPASPPSPTDTALFAAMRRAAAATHPGVVITESMSTGATDSRYFRQRGVPAYGFFPVLLPEAMLSTAHGIDERLPVTALGHAVRVIYQALRTL
jgi:acetylornithine deacetylase/succinyl-diaminopimelate desuccinylase-like protein